MSYRPDEEVEQWEHDHNHRIIWKCFACREVLEFERNMNSNPPCPSCGKAMEEAGESYD